MYVKRYVRGRGDKRYVYLRLVESYRDADGKVRHRVLQNLGREDELKASGQLDQLAASFARLDPPMAGVRREVGPMLLVGHYLAELGVAQSIDRAIPQRGRAQLTTGEVVAALVANRLCGPAPLYDIAGWAGQAALHELLGIPGMLLNDDRLGRALERFAPVAEQVRGAILLRAVERFGTDSARLHLDLTALRVAGAYEDSSLVAPGRDATRTIKRQIQILQAVNADGVSLYSRTEPGNTAELRSIGAALETLLEHLPEGFLLCTDSAFGHAKTLCQAARAGLRFVIPLRASSGFADTFLHDVGVDALTPLRYISRRDRGKRPGDRTVYKGALRPLTITDPETGERHPLRVAYIFSSEEQTSVAEARERALTRAEDALGRVQRGLGGRHYKTQAAVDARVAQILTGGVKDLLVVRTGTREGRPTLTYARDDEAIARARRTDGIYALATNIPGRLSATRVLRLYKDQGLVEMRHKDVKGPLRVRPVFLHNDDRIEGLVAIVGLAVLIFGLAEWQLRKALGADERLDGLLPEGRAARPTGRNIFAAFQGLGLTYTPEGVVLDRLTGTQRRILELLEVPITWPEAGGLGSSDCGKRA